MTDSFAWGKWLIQNRKEVNSLPLHFLTQFWHFYNEKYGEIGIAVDDDNSEGFDIIATVLDCNDEERKLENAALIANAPQMFRLLFVALKHIHDDELLDDICLVLAKIIKPV